MISVVCWLWKGDRGYRPAHVNALRQMIAANLKTPHRFICVTDQAEGFDRGVEVVKTPAAAMTVADVPTPEGGRFPSCYRRLWMFSAEAPKVLGERVLLVDLDVVVTGDLTPLVERTESFVGWRPKLGWGTKDRVAGGLYLMTPGAHPEVWTDFNAEGIAAARKAKFRGSDQAWLSFKLGKDVALWPDDAGIYALSDLRGDDSLPSDARMVQFSGPDKPWDCSLRWVRRNYPAIQPAAFTDIVLKHKGARVVVMGGAPGLAEQIDGLKADVWISANDHGAKLRDVDYIVAMDDQHGETKENMRARLRKVSQAPIIGPWPHNDYQLSEWPDAPRKVLSGMVGAWCAWAMGAKVVILTGMNGYDGRAGAIRDARLMASQIHCPIRIIGAGPLADTFQQYDPAETFGRYTPHSSINGLLGRDGEVRIRVIKPTQVRGIDVKRGDEITVMRHEVARLIRHRMVAEV